MKHLIVEIVILSDGFVGKGKRVLERGEHKSVAVDQQNVVGSDEVEGRGHDGLAEYFQGGVDATEGEG